MSKNNTEEYKHYTEVCEELGHFWIQKVAEFSFQFKLKKKNKQFWGVAAGITEHHLFLFFFPLHTTTGCKPEQQMMYAGSKNKLVQTAELTKV